MYDYLLYLRVTRFIISWSPESRMRRKISVISLEASELLKRYFKTAFFHWTICFLKAFSILKGFKINTYTKHLFFEKIDRIDSFVIDRSFAFESHVVHVQLKYRLYIGSKKINEFCLNNIYLYLGSSLVSLDNDWFARFVIDPHRWFGRINTRHWLHVGCISNFAKYLGRR